MMYTFSIKSIKALILDMDGVLWRGDETIGDLPSIFSKINQLNLKVIFATNNATRTPEQYVAHLGSIGVKAAPEQIITSAAGIIKHLKDLFPQGGKIFIIGEKGLREACAENGYVHSATDPLAVVAGLDRELTYEKLVIATLLIRNGVPFFGTNPDLTFPTPEGLVPGAGSILAALKAASNVEPIIAGKPEPTMYQIALERLNLPATNVLVVGDRPETDIIGAQKIGCHTALVLSGVTSLDQALEWQPAPDIIAENLETILSEGFVN